MPQASLNGIRIDYQEFSPENKKFGTIVFMHGRGGNLLSWFQQIPYFSKKFYCIAYSQRGFGNSYDIDNGPGWSAFPKDLELLMDFLNIDKAHLIAQSMGGISALGFAVEHSNRVLSITFADTTGGMGEPLLENELIEWKNKYPRTRGRLEAISEKFENDNPEMANLYLQISLTNPELANPEMALDKINLLGGPKGQELNALKMPVLFLVGQDDTLMPPHIIKLASEYIKDSEFLIIPDCGHSVYWEKPYVFNSEVNRFISDSIS